MNLQIISGLGAVGALMMAFLVRPSGNSDPLSRRIGINVPFWSLLGLALIGAGVAGGGTIPGTDVWSIALVVGSGCVFALVGTAFWMALRSMLRRNGGSRG